MALSAAVPQIAAVLAPTGVGSSRGSMLKGQGVSFGARSIAPLKSLDSKSRISGLEKRPTVCMSAQVSPPCLDVPQEDLYGVKEPYSATINSVKTIAGTPGQEGEVCHVEIQHDGKVPFLEGQCCQAVLPNPENWKSYAYFSLATTRYGDDFDGKTASFCVKRVKDGTVSNYLCNAKGGEPIGLAENGATQIMVAEKTGIAPFRGYLRRMFLEHVPFQFQGLAWLFFGVEDDKSLLYGDELLDFAKNNPRYFEFETAFRSGKKTVVDLIEDKIDVLYTLLNTGAYVSFCGPDDMMPGITNAFREEAWKRGENWDEKYLKLTATNQWREIVYQYGHHPPGYHPLGLPENGYGKSENAVFVV